MSLVDKPWQIEQRGLERIEATDRHGRITELLYIWFSANIGFLGLLYGAIIVTYHLSFGQGILAAVLGSTSFLLVGMLGISGKNSGYPMLVLARRPFGKYGNVLPSLISWVNLLGWETIIWVTATEAILSLCQDVWGWGPNLLWTTLLFLCIGGGTFVIALYGHATVVKMQKWISLIFGASTCAIILKLVSIHQIHFIRVATPTSFSQGFLPAVAFIFVGTGLSWTTTAADYTRYLPKVTSSTRIVFMTFAGAAVPLVGLIIAGMLLTPSLPGFATSANPLHDLGHGLPLPWLVIFWFTATVGLLTENILAIYSSGLTLLTMHVHIPRPHTAIWEFCLTGTVGWYFLTRNMAFFSTFQTFLIVVGSLLAPWVGVMFIDILFKIKHEHRYGIGCSGLLAWTFGVIVTLAFTSSPLWNGVFSKNMITTNQLGFFAGLLTSSVTYLILFANFRKK